MSLLTDRAFRRAITVLPVFKNRIKDFYDLLSILGTTLDNPGDLVEKVAAFQGSKPGLSVDGVLGEKTAFAIRGLKWLPTPGENLLALGDKKVKIGSKVLRFDEPGGLTFKNLPGWRIRDPNKPPRVVILHWDVDRSSHGCYQTLLARKLSIHFMVDNDGTIYQAGNPSTMTAFHAGSLNDTSIGIEINSPGTLLSLDDKARPRPRGILGVRNSKQEALYFYPEQVSSVLNLVTTLCAFYAIPKVLPGVNNIVSNDVDNRILGNQYSGICGHYHCSLKGKIDPGIALWPAFLNAG